jgi:hypothetical protein
MALYGNSALIACRFLGAHSTRCHKTSVTVEAVHGSICMSVSRDRLLQSIELITLISPYETARLSVSPKWSSVVISLEKFTSLLYRHNAQLESRGWKSLAADWIYVKAGFVASATPRQAID